MAITDWKIPKPGEVAAWVLGMNAKIVKQYLSTSGTYWYVPDGYIFALKGLHLRNGTGGAATISLNIDDIQYFITTSIASGNAEMFSDSLGLVYNGQGNTMVKTTPSITGKHFLDLFGPGTKFEPGAATYQVGIFGHLIAIGGEG